MHKVKIAENFAKIRHSHVTGSDFIPRYEHLSGVVARLKNLGITDEDVISAAWLHDTIKDTNTSFDELDKRFGSKVAVLVLALSRDKNLPKGRQEEQYVRQLKEAPLEVKLIKLCDISADLKELNSAPFSKTKKTKDVKKKLYYLNIIKPEIIRNKSQFPGIVGLINGINDSVSKYGLRPLIL